MSHFAVMVIGEDPEEQLAPFQENNMEDCPEEYLEFQEEMSYGEAVKKFQEEKKTTRKPISSKLIEFIQETEGYVYDIESNSFGYMSNPNAKWDWYELGGRWTGFFKVKKGKKQILGRPGVFNNRAMPETTDAQLKKNIDWEKMKESDNGVPFAYIKDGEWHERGSMGWFGSVNDEKDFKIWKETYYKMIEELDDETWLYLYDCHI